MSIINRLMWIAMFTSSYRCAVTEVLTGAVPGVSVDTMSAVTLDVDAWRGMEIVVMTTPAITLEFVVEVGYGADVMSGELSFIIIDIVSAIDIGMFLDENLHGLVAVMIPVEFTLLSL